MRRQVACALAVVASVVCTPLPGMAQGTIAVSGAVVGVRDSLAVFTAEIRDSRGRILSRSDPRGEFVISAQRGDSLLVRALGFRAQRVVVTGAALLIRLEAATTVLPLFVTTVGQRVIRASESPRSVTVLGQHEIAAVAAIAVNQLLRQVPGLQELPGAPSKTSISIRGFDDARVLVLIDGEPVAGSLIESRDIGRLSTIATERIEVTKGPSSVEFGSDALGGVINIVQAAPTHVLTVDGMARAGELGRQESTIGVSHTVGKLGYRANAGWRQSNRVTGYDAVGSTFDRIYDLRSDVRYALTERVVIRLDALASQERQRFPLDGQFNGFIDNRGAQGFAEVQAAVGHGSVRARVFEQRFSYQYRQARGLLPIRGSADSLEQQERQSRYLASYTRVLRAHTMDVGVQRAVRSLSAPRKVDGDTAEDRVNEVYARDSWMTGALQVTIGARHSRSQLWGSSTNPSVGVAWQPASSLRLRTNVSQGFRAPSFKELRYTFFNAAGGYTLAGNAALRPEASRSGAVGATWSPSVRCVIDIEGYRNDVTNLIDWRFQGTNGAGYQVYRNVNVARARTQGVEASLRGMFGPSEWSLGYDYLRARDLGSGLPLSRRATHTARLRVSREWAVLRGLSADWSTRYTGSAVLVGVPSGAPITGAFATGSGIVASQGAFLSVDGQLRLAMTRQAELSIGVNNAFDQRPTLWTPAFARQMYVGVRVRWADTPP